MSHDEPKRSPQVFDADDPFVRPSEQPSVTGGADNGDGPDTDTAAGQTPREDATGGQPQSQLARGFRWGALLFSAIVGLGMLAAGVWFARFATVALARDDWVGWTANALLAAAGLAALVLVLKEIIGIFRMARLSRIRREAEVALAKQDRRLEKRAVAALKGLARGRSQSKWNLAAFREDERHMREHGQLLGLADRVLLAEPDREARRIVFESARRVAIVTAVVPIALLVMLFVFSENVRMVRRLADAYGGRPGTLGGLRLLWRVIMHVAATGAVALTDDLFGQFLGQDIVRRISRRLGEGAFIGALTARLGVAAIEVCRSLPYIEAKPLRSRHVVRELFPELNVSELAKSAFTRGKKPDASET